MPFTVAHAATLKPDAPLSYTVTEGDTLWSVAGRFLAHPWQWPEVWQSNPAIADPDRIYPGDRLLLTHDASGVHLRLERGSSHVIKLSPQMRALPSQEAIATLERSAVAAFLGAHRVVDPGMLDVVPHVVAGDEGRLINAAGDRVFVSGALPATSRHFGLYAPGEVYHDRDGALLGQALTALGEAQLEKPGRPLTALRLTHVSREVEAGTLVLARDDGAVEPRFVPHPVGAAVTGHILATPDETRVIGARSIVVLDLGRRDGLEPGHVLGVQRQGEKVNDPLTNEVYHLPDEEAGTLMVFRCFDRVSYALVMRADTPLAIGDRVGAPAS